MSGLNAMTRTERLVVDQMSELKKKQGELRAKYIEIDILLSIMRANVRKSFASRGADYDAFDEANYVRITRRRKVEKIKKDKYDKMIDRVKGVNENYK